MRRGLELRWQKLEARRQSATGERYPHYWNQMAATCAIKISRKSPKKFKTDCKWASSLTLRMRLGTPE
jgi:hypothetical protein